jgi:hypothetical protein
MQRRSRYENEESEGVTAEQIKQAAAILGFDPKIFEKDSK